MDRIITALTGVVSKNTTALRKRPLRVDVGSAPPTVRALAEALATHDYNVDLGELSMYSVGDDGHVSSLASTIQTSCEEGGIDLAWLLSEGGPGGGAFDPEQTMQLGADGGGMSYFGVSWSGGIVAMVVVEFDDPTEDNVVRFFTTPADFFAFVDHLNRREDEPLPVVDALKAAAGIATPKREVAPDAQPSSGLTPLTGKMPAHPFALAMEHFGVKRMVFQAGPTPAGRRVLVRRFAAGAPPTPAAIVVFGSAGAEHTLEWQVPRDVFGVCAVPGQERALLCTGTPGPLIELDLETGAERQLLPAVGWSCGFVDPEHLAVLSGGEARVYRYSDGALGEPVAALPVAGFNVFVGHGRVFHRTREAPASLRVIAWNGRELVEEGVFAVDSKLFSLHAAIEQQGQKLVGFVSTDGKASWFVI
jgi:hypothetical protein